MIWRNDLRKQIPYGKLEKTFEIAATVRAKRYVDDSATRVTLAWILQVLKGLKK